MAIGVVVTRILPEMKTKRPVPCIPIEPSCLLRYYPAAKGADTMDDVTSKPVPGATSAAAVDSPAAGAAELAKKTGIAQVGESSHELRALHGLRFLAAFCILFSHACAWLANFKDTRTIFNYSEFFTVYGMPLFFVLSGFVIHYNYSRLFSTMRPRWAILEFLGARFARLYPLFICFFLVGVAVDGVLQWYYEHELNLLLAMGHYLTLTQSWVYIAIFGDRLLLDGPFGLSWSLSTEFFFYVTYVVLVLHIARMRSIAGLFVTAGAMSVLVVSAFSYAASHRGAIGAFAVQYMNQIGGEEHSVFRWFFYYSPYGRVFEFILGCLTAQIYAIFAAHPVSPREERWGRILLGASLVFLFGFALVFLFKPFGGNVAIYVTLLKQNFGCAVGLAVLIFCVSRYRSSTVALMLSTPLMVQLGDLSFSIYAVHTYSLRIFERPSMNFRYGIELEAAFRIVLGIALTLILSTATFRLIEVPARAWLRKIVARRLLRSFGPREANMLAPGQTYSARREIVVGMTFVAMIGALVAYQFLIVPSFTPYVR
jgi:peptidoglycan/LPS O-acetylase OafA/YrhL